MAVRRISLGPHGFDVSAQGLGCMSMSKPEADMINLIRHAVSIGVTHLDTSDVYGPHTNEVLVGMALREVPRDKVQIATKFGCRMVAGSLEVSGHPDYVKEACEASLKRLGVDFIDLYYVHRIDTTIPIEITIGALKQLFEEGKVKHIGLSEASLDTIRRAHVVHPITAIQLEWSLWTRDAEDQLIPTCRELGIGIVPYRPLGKGFFASGAKVIESSGFRENVPKFNPENIEHNNKLYEQVSVIVARKGCTTSQLALAWLHHQEDDVCPIPGTTKMENLESNIKALSVKLTTGDMSELEAIATPDAVKGDRYSAAGMARTWRFANTPPLSSWKASE